MHSRSCGRSARTLGCARIAATAVAAGRTAMSATTWSKGHTRRAPKPPIYWIFTGVIGFLQLGHWLLERLALQLLHMWILHFGH